MDNILTKTHEDSPKYTCIILGHVSTITQALSMNPPNACHVPDHQTDLLPTVETSTYMHCMDSPLVAHPKLPTWIKIVLPQTESMVEKEMAMTGAGTKRSLYALSGEIATEAKDRQK